MFQFSEDSPTELTEQLPTTTHETEQVTPMFYSQHGELKAQGDPEFFDKFDPIKDEKDKPGAEKLQALSKSENFMQVKGVLKTNFLVQD